jgi:hypothetical protein
MPAAADGMISTLLCARGEATEAMRRQSAEHHRPHQVTLRSARNGLAGLIGKRNETIGYAIIAFFYSARIAANVAKSR